MFEAGKKPRAQIRLPQGSYIQTDQWMDHLGYEQYCWWLKFHSWVNRKSDRVYEQHIPVPLEDVFERLGVSQTTFYRKIKVLWECGLIEIIEFEKSERKSQKPKNIIVYEYPFNRAEFEYLPLEKRRDWKKDYESSSKLAGIKGAILKKEKYPPKSERVEKPVDNYPPKIERVHPPNSERVTLPELGANNVLNNLLINSNNPINDFNNSLSLTKADLIKEMLIEFNFSEGEREKIIELINKRQLLDVSKQDILNQARSMMNKPEIVLRAQYFVNGLEANIGRIHQNKKEPIQKEGYKRSVPFYNWLES